MKTLYKTVVITPVQRQAIRISALWWILTGLSGCSFLPFSPSKPITKIGDVPQQAGKATTIYLQGEVGKQVPLLGQYAYELKDATGTIWVVTTQKLPTQAHQVTLKGKVQRKNIRIGNKNIPEVYIEEQEERFVQSK